jgi:excisionase family DNA binding protein
MTLDTRERPVALSFKKLTELTGVSQSTWRRIAKTGQLQTIRIGRRRLVAYTALMELLRNGGPYQSSSEKSQ